MPNIPSIGTIVAIILVILVLLVIISNIVIDQQSKAYVVERLGAFRAVWNVGQHLKVPFIERVAKKVSLKEQAQRLTLTRRYNEALSLHFGAIGKEKSHE